MLTEELRDTLHQDASDTAPHGARDMDEMEAQGDYQFDLPQQPLESGPSLSDGSEAQKQHDAMSAAELSLPASGFEGFRDQLGPSDPRALLEDWELMTALANAAAGSDVDNEVSAFVAAMVPVALRLAPCAGRALWPAIPQLLQDVVRVARALHARPGGRHVVRQLPLVIRRATARLAREAADGQVVTRALAAQVLAKEVRRAVGAAPNPIGARPRQARVKREMTGYAATNGLPRYGAPPW